MVRELKDVIFVFSPVALQSILDIYSILSRFWSIKSILAVV